MQVQALQADLRRAQDNLDALRQQAARTVTHGLEVQRLTDDNTLLASRMAQLEGDLGCAV